jgi:hypothetical protein
MIRIGKGSIFPTRQKISSDIIRRLVRGVSSLNADSGQRGGTLSVKPETCLQSDTRNGNA